MISFIIPAHNEERWIGRTLCAIRTAMKAVGEPHEIIVVDDASTDATARVADEHGARVLRVTHRQIAATRNSGAREARGDLFFFVDADTLANAEAIRAALQAMRSGAIGGGCVFTFDGIMPLWARIVFPVGLALGRWLKLVGGCFVFCTRQAYEAVGGFCERYYAGEELVFLKALKRKGRLVVPTQTVVTSGRKLRVVSAWEVIAILFRLLLRGLESYQRREELDFLYGKRSENCRL